MKCGSAPSMRDQGVCRFCENQSNLIFRQKKGDRREFTMPGSKTHYAPDRPFRPEHILLNLKVDPKLRTVEGTVTHFLKPLDLQADVIKFDQVDLQIQDVTSSNVRLPFQVTNHCLEIQLSPLIEKLKNDEVFEVSIQYRTHHPRRGIYFTAPDSDYPKKRYQVWTQGQDEDSRFWFPTLDYPNQKATSEMKVLVPSGFTAVSNGALMAHKTTEEGQEYFHYRLGVPHVTYLITLVVGEWSQWTDFGPRNLPVQYFVEPGREEDGKRSFAHTPRMIEVFENKTGVAFPYEKYSQVAVQDFIFGGMENTSATTQTDLTLHDQRAQLDFSSDPLVSHELAHQWFGDLITCRDWSHGWLNEGFATFMERVWVEENPGPTGGLEEAKYYSYQDFKEHLQEDQGRYRRSIVCNTYIEPIDLFDTHLYQKGGLVVHLLRYLLGEFNFWKSIKHYLQKHRGQSVETIDLIRAIEETTGKNLRRFFDEWVFNAGYPEFEIHYEWHEKQKMTEWVIEQKQTGGALSKTDQGFTTLLFHLPVVIELTLASGEKIKHGIEIGEMKERVFLPADSRPVMVRFDPGFNIPRLQKFPRPKEMLLYQLKNDPDCMGRIEAVQELAKIADPDILQSLSETALFDRFWGVQVEAAKALGEIRTDSSKLALLNALHTSHPKGRRAIVNALSHFRDPGVAQALRSLAEKDESYFVEADATLAFVQASKEPFQTLDLSQVEPIEDFLFHQLRKDSYREVIRSAALLGLAELPGIQWGERPRAFDQILSWTKRGNTIDARTAAIRALGKILKTASASVKAKILENLDYFSGEENFRLRMQIVSSLEESECAEASSILSRIHDLDSDGRVRRNAKWAFDSLKKSKTFPAALDQLRTAFEKLEDDQRKLRSKLIEQESLGVSSHH